MKNRTPAAKRHRILLVDDHPLFRQGLAQLLALEPDLAVCGQAEDTAQAVRTVETQRPDLVIVDISLNGGDGIELVKDLKATHPKLPTLVVSMHDEVLYAERALRAGALGYVMKRAGTGEVLEAIRHALVGEVYVSPDMKNRLLLRLAGLPTPEMSPLAQLSDRELEVYRLTGDGLNLRQIAKQLKISTSTVESHRARIKEKLGLSTAAELVRHALQWSNRESRQ
jgi:DNA-binding NarL/FixJ family response regulator